MLFQASSGAQAAKGVAKAAGEATAMVSQSQQPDVLSAVSSLINQGRLTEAEQTLRGYLTDHPNSADGHFLLGYTLFREIQAKASLTGHRDRQFQEDHAKAALGEFDQAARYRNPRAFELKIVALTYVLLDDYSDADKWLTRSVELNGNDSEAWYYLGRARYNEERFDSAIAAFQHCLALHPTNVKAEDNLGLAYAAVDRYQEAIAAYKHAISWQSDSLIKDSGPYIDLGLLLLEQNHAQEAIPYLARGVEISPEEPRAHAALGKAYSKTNDLHKAQAEFEKAVDLAPENASLHYVLGQLYRKLGLLDKAQAEFNRTAELNESHSSPMNDLATKAPK
jgi:tetratricopeptide (TPR) repeat protein